MSQGKQEAARLVPIPQTSSSTGAGSSAHFPSLLLQPFLSSQPGLEIPTRMPGWDHSMVQVHTARLSQGQRVPPATGSAAVVIPKQPPVPAAWTGMQLQAGGLEVWRGTRQLLWHCSLHTHPGASQSHPSPGWGSGQPLLHKGQGEDSEGWGCPPAPPPPPAPAGLLKIAPTMGALSGLGGTEQGPSAGTVTPQEFRGVRGKIFLLSRTAVGIAGTLGTAGRAGLPQHQPLMVSPERRVWCHATPVPSFLGQEWSPSPFPTTGIPNSAGRGRSSGAVMVARPSWGRWAQPQPRHLSRDGFTHPPLPTASVLFPFVQTR